MSWLSSWPLKCMQSAARRQRADRFRQRDPHRAGLGREIHRGDIGAVIKLQPAVALAMGGELRDLLREMGQMNEAAEGRREAFFQDAEETVERGVAKKRSGGARQPRRNTRREQSALDRTQRQAGAHARRAIRLDRRIGETGAVIVGDLEIEQVETETLEPDHRLARRKAKADDDGWPQLAQQLLQTLAQATLADRQDCPDHGKAVDRLAIERLRDLGGRVDAPSAIGLETGHDDRLVE